MVCTGLIINELAAGDDATKPVAKPDTVVVSARVTEDLTLPRANTVVNADGKKLAQPGRNEAFRYTLADLYTAANVAAEWTKANPTAKNVHFGARIDPDGVTVLMIGHDALVEPRPIPGGK
jgi:hypothetical protein